MDSTAMIVELAERGEPIDMVLFADPGSEKAGTYGDIPIFRRWMADHGIPSEIVRYPVVYRAEVTVEAEDLVTACRAALDAACDTSAWKSLDYERPTHVTAIAEGADVDPWRLAHDGGDISVLPVPLLFSGGAMVAGYAVAKSDDLADQLRIMVDAIGADGGLRITPEAVVRLRATGQAILDDITAFGLSPTSNAAPSVVLGSPDAT